MLLGTRPIVGGSAGHIDDRKCRIDLPDQARNLPTLHRPLEVDVGYERRILDHALSVRPALSCSPNKEPSDRRGIGLGAAPHTPVGPRRKWPQASPVRSLGLPGFVIPASRRYIRLMPRKPIELAPAVARNFLKDMRAFFAEPNLIKRDEIAAWRWSMR